MSEPVAGANAAAQRRFRDRRKSEREWFRREVTRLTVEIAKLRLAQLPNAEEFVRE